MKKSNYFRAALMAMVTMFAMTACEPNDWYYIDRGSDVIYNNDRTQSYYFTGQWTGDFGMYYNYSYAGHIYTFDSYDTDIVFYPAYDGASYGTGKQVDFYQYGPYEYMYNSFSWEIRNGIVYLRYHNDPSLDVDIYNYYMSSTSFSGRFGASGSTFSLHKIADYYDWRTYTGDYLYYSRPDWTVGFSFARDMNTTANDSANDEAKQDGTVSFGRRAPLGSKTE